MTPSTAEEGLNAFNKARGYSDTLENDIIDLITDLLLLAKRRNEDPQAILRMVQTHFEEESNEMGNKS